MSIGEQIFLRVFLVLFIVLAVFLFRLAVALLKKLFAALFGGNRTPVEPVKPTPAAPPPVSRISSVPPAPPVVPPGPSVQTPVVPPAPPVQTPVVPEEKTVPLYEEPQTMADPAPYWMHFSRPRVRALNGPLMGQSFSLDGAVTVGRDPSSGIVFPANTPGISGHHCLISAMENTGCGTYDITLMDRQSTYGTYLSNGQRLQPGQSHYLNIGDIFVLGGPNGCAFRLEQN